MPGTNTLAYFGHSEVTKIKLNTFYNDDSISDIGPPTFSITTHSDTQHNGLICDTLSIMALSIYHYYTECRDYLNVMQIVVVLNVVMLRVVMLSVVILSVVAP
jgi:hypothetical protein